MVKRMILLLTVLAMVLAAGSSAAELKLLNKTPGQQMLRDYMAHVNEFLLENGEEEINKKFDETDSVVEMGITLDDDAFMPEHVTVTVYRNYDSLYFLILRVDDPERFPQVAAAFLRALNPKTMTAEEALKTPTERAQKALKKRADSFEDVEIDKYKEWETEILVGEKPQTYYAYYPNQYHNSVDWMQMMIIFPAKECWDTENGVITQNSEIKSYQDENQEAEDYDWYFSDDPYIHSETFATATPEPDSAAAEFDQWNP